MSVRFVEKVSRVDEGQNRLAMTIKGCCRIPKIISSSIWSILVGRAKKPLKARKGHLGWW
jgi:hypothetical protein